MGAIDSVDGGSCSDELSTEELLKAVEVLRQGGVVAMPTETYYGLAVDPFNELALSRLFKAKQRPIAKPILTLISSVDQLSLLTDTVPPAYQPLINTIWPGPLTLIFEARHDLPNQLTAGTGTVGVRISSHPVADQLIGLAGIPLTATSANISGMPPAKKSEEVWAQFGSEIDLVLEAGSTPAGLCSTIVGLDDDEIVLIRDGAVPFSFVKTIAAG